MLSCYERYEHLGFYATVALDVVQTVLEPCGPRRESSEEETRVRVGGWGGYHLQQSKRQVTMDMGLQLDLDLEVEFKPQLERVLAATISLRLLLLHLHLLLLLLLLLVEHLLLLAVRQLLVFPATPAATALLHLLILAVIFLGLLHPLWLGLVVVTRCRGLRRRRRTAFVLLGSGSARAPRPSHWLLFLLGLRLLFLLFLLVRLVLRCLFVMFLGMLLALLLLGCFFSLPFFILVVLIQDLLVLVFRVFLVIMLFFMVRTVILMVHFFVVVVRFFISLVCRLELVVVFLLVVFNIITLVMFLLGLLMDLRRFFLLFFLLVRGVLMLFLLLLQCQYTAILTACRWSIAYRCHCVLWYLLWDCCVTVVGRGLQAGGLTREIAKLLSGSILNRASAWWDEAVV